MPENDMNYSTDKALFPGSELIEWEGSDKPLRNDVNYDNERLTNAAMWKYQYDPDGTVGGTTDGIVGYALAKSTYDQNGGIALAGGIQAAIDEAVVEMTDDYMKKTDYAANSTAAIDGSSLTISSVDLPRPTDNYTVQFTAPADYSPAGTIDIDGTTMTALKDISGVPVDVIAWKVGSPVTLFRRGSVAYINLQMPIGGGAFAGPVTVPGDSENTTGHLRNIFLSTTTTWPAGAQDGDILLVYT